MSAKQERPLGEIICLDFDGVLHSYTSGWKGAHVISDPPVPGAMGFVAALCSEFYVHIYSSRSHQPGGIEAMKEWLAYCLMEEGYDERLVETITFSTVKPPAKVSLDDRAIQFTGKWPSLSELRTFKPWNKK